MRKQVGVIVQKHQSQEAAGDINPLCNVIRSSSMGGSHANDGIQQEHSVSTEKGW